MVHKHNSASEREFNGNESKKKKDTLRSQHMIVSEINYPKKENYIQERVKRHTKNTHMSIE